MVKSMSYRIARKQKARKRELELRTDAGAPEYNLTKENGCRFKSQVHRPGLQVYYIRETAHEDRGMFRLFLHKDT